MGDCRCRRNVYMLGVAFLCNFASYMTLESMQSSLNRGIGTTALCLLYTVLVISSMFLPPLVVAKLDCRKSLFFSILMFALYTLANFYPKAYTLTPAAILLGMGSSVMWASAFYYIIQLSQKHAEETDKEVDAVTSEFFGKFSAISHFSILVGTIFMSVVFESLGSGGNSPETNVVVTADNFSVWETTQVNDEHWTTQNPSSSSEENTKCGLYYKFAAVKDDVGVSNTIMYILLSAYLAFNLLAAMLCLCLDEVKGIETKALDEAVATSMISLNGNKEEMKAINGKKDDEEKKSLSDTSMKQVEVQEDKSALKLVKSTFTVLFSDKAVILLIPFTLHYGMIQGFVRGVYNASWITCALGIKFVAYVTGMYAVVMIIGCYTFGKIFRYTTHIKMFLCTMSLEIVLFTVLMLWQPNPNNMAEVWIFFAIPFGFGISHSSLSSQLGSVYSRFFSENKKQGTALLGVWNPMGSAIAYGLSGPLYPIHMIIMVMSMCVVGTIFYLVAERIKDKKYRKCSNKSCF